MDFFGKKPGVQGADLGDTCDEAAGRDHLPAREVLAADLLHWFEFFLIIQFIQLLIRLFIYVGIRWYLCRYLFISKSSELSFLFVPHLPGDGC